MTLSVRPEAHSTFEPAPSLTTREQKLREHFVAIFRGDDLPRWEMRVALWELTDEMKTAGELPEAVVKRVKHIAKLPMTAEDRFSSKDGDSRLLEVMSSATTACIERYFSPLAD